MKTREELIDTNETNDVDVYAEDLNMEACMKEVTKEIEEYGLNPFESLGRAIIRAEQDSGFNKNMIKAYKKYIEDGYYSWKTTWN